MRSHTTLRIRRVRQHSEQGSQSARLAKDIFRKPFDKQRAELAKSVDELSELQRLLNDFEFKGKGVVRGWPY